MAALTANFNAVTPLRGESRLSCYEYIKLISRERAGAYAGERERIPPVYLLPLLNAAEINREQHRKRFRGALSRIACGCSSASDTQQRGNADRRQRAKGCKRRLLDLLSGVVLDGITPQNGGHNLTFIAFVVSLRCTRVFRAMPAQHTRVHPHRHTAT